MTGEELAKIERRLSDVIRATGDNPTQFEIADAVRSMREGSLRTEDVHRLLAEVKALRTLVRVLESNMERPRLATGNVAPVVSAADAFDAGVRVALGDERTDDGDEGTMGDVHGALCLDWLLSGVDRAREEALAKNPYRTGNAPIYGLRWTTERPKVEGHFWYRESTAVGAMVVSIFRDQDGLHVDEGAEATLLDAETYKGQWAGPIPEPTT